jgi:hypothetical protein
LEFGANDTAVSVWAGDAAPDAADLTLGGVLAEVDVRHTLAQVEQGVLSVVDTLELDQRCVVVLVDLGALETEEDTLGIQAGSLGVCLAGYALGNLGCAWSTHRESNESKREGLVSRGLACTWCICM